MKYLGITYFNFLDNKFILKIWKKIFCKINIHLFDECLTSDGEHYLVCDACDLIIHIKYFQGSIPNIIIHNKVLTYEEILEKYEKIKNLNAVSQEK